MSKLHLRGKDLRRIGFPEGPVISLAINSMERFYKHMSREDALTMLQKVVEEPAHFIQDEALGKVAEALVPKPPVESDEIALLPQPVPYSVYGSEFIEQGALEQMNQAVRLPVSIAGALMPDAHSGYGLPIGGVLATENAVIPYGVGVDIGCRMCLSVFDINPEELTSRETFFSRELNENTVFGAGRELKKTVDHPILDRKEFYELGLLRGLHDKAVRQLGTSGSGNHFVEFGEVMITEKDDQLGLAPGNYLGLLSHSGSRTVGANVANHFTRVAKQKRKLPKEASNLAWFSLDEEEGLEYWIAMNLAGDYASACHHVIHEKIARQLGREPLRMVENHHNFAWKERWKDRDLIVHRKGATPAGRDVLGIIPGSMTAPGFIVKGKGIEQSINSASHGAGRKMSRTAAIKSITQSNLKEMLREHAVKLIGGGLDEAPQAYKDIRVVMQAQEELVDVLGTFMPRIVKMDS